MGREVRARKESRKRGIRKRGRYNAPKSSSAVVNTLEKGEKQKNARRTRKRGREGGKPRTRHESVNEKAKRWQGDESGAQAKRRRKPTRYRE